MPDNNPIDPNIEKKLRSRNLEEVLEAFTDENREIVLELFYKTSKLLYARQLQSGNKTFSRKQVAYTINTAFYHHCKQTKFDAKHNLSLLKKTTDEKFAGEYFKQNLAGKKIKDFTGQEVLIKPERVDCIYKDEQEKKHSVSPSFFQLYRARRLPWIIPTLQGSKEIYYQRKEKYKCDELFYIGTFSQEFHPDDAGEDEPKSVDVNYFVVLVRRKHGYKDLEFITAYPIFDYWHFLKHLDLWIPVK